MSNDGTHIFPANIVNFLKDVTFNMNIRLNKDKIDKNKDKFNINDNNRKNKEIKSSNLFLSDAMYLRILLQQIK